MNQPKTKHPQRKTLSRNISFQERVLLVQQNLQTIDIRKIKILLHEEGAQPFFDLQLPNSNRTRVEGHGEAPAQPAHFEADRASKNIARPIGGPALPRSC